jgi:hypothetical protein
MELALSWAIQSLDVLKIEWEWWGDSRRSANGTLSLRAILRSRGRQGARRRGSARRPRSRAPLTL